MAVENSYIISVDQSTAGTKAIVADKNANIIYRCGKNHRQITPKAGWVEHDPQEIYRNVIWAIEECVEQSGIDKVAAVALTNQRETVLAWNKKTGEPLYNAVVWQCNRARTICRELGDKDTRNYVKHTTGIPLSEYFSAAKLAWIIQNCAGEVPSEDILVGTVDTWIVWKLTDGASHVTDYSNASRTQLFNLETLCWDDRLLRIFGLKKSMMPKVIGSDEIAGHVQIKGRLIPIAGILGDSHGALFAQAAFERGIAKTTYGTGSSIMVNTGGERVLSDRLATSIAWGTRDGVSYVLEGNINSTGATIKWLCERLRLTQDVDQVERMACSVENTGGVYLVPAFVGLNSPYWDSKAKALISGMTFATQKEHIARAALESIAYQIKDVVDCMKTQGKQDIRELRVDGQATQNRFLMQFQADVLGIPVVKNRIQEASAFGAALMAGIAVNIWDRQEIDKLIGIGERIENRMDTGKVNRLYAGWLDAVARSIQHNKIIL